MSVAHPNSFTKQERLCGKNSISTLLSDGRWGASQNLRYCFTLRDGQESISRLLVSVPKKHFKRAVKRNLLKRRIREAYRTNKSVLAEGPAVDFMVVYAADAVLDFQTISAEIVAIRSEICRKASSLKQ